METETKKSNIGVIILVAIIVALLSIGGTYLLIVNRYEDKIDKLEKEVNNLKGDTVEEKDTYVSTTPDGIIATQNDGTKTGDFTLDNKTYTYELTDKEFIIKHSGEKVYSYAYVNDDMMEDDEKDITVYKDSDHIIIKSKPNVYVTAIVLNKNMKKVLDVQSYDYFDFKDNKVFYVKDNCNGTRKDGSIGETEEYYEYDLKTDSDNHVRTEDHEAGWAC